MNRSQVFLIAILCVASLQKLVDAGMVEQGHRDSHNEKDFLRRNKRYALGRVPLSYMSVGRPSQQSQQSRIDADGDDSTGYTIEKRFRSNGMHTNPAASHFRELQVRQTRRPFGDGGLTPAQLQAFKNLQYYGYVNGGDSMNLDGPEYGEIPQSPPDDVGPLTDEELQTLLLLLDGYRIQEGKAKPPPPRNFYTSPAQYFLPEIVDATQMGKRETGKRSRSSQLGAEQPMSFENSVGDSFPVFLNSKRTKRIGDSPAKVASSIRIKKETDPAVEATLDKLFGGQQQVEKQQHQSTSIPTTAISSSDQIPAPSSSQTKTKKAINWSDYFGVDKRQDKKLSEAKPAQLPTSDAINHHVVDHEHEAINKHVTQKNDKDKSTNSPSSNVGSAVEAPGNTGKSEKLKDKKDKDRQENDTEVKPDRKWILQEFYKNLAMATNVKRKRESPVNTERVEKLDKLEKIERKMEEAGDQIIWDTLKYTGAHRDAELSPAELADVKKEIIQKLSAAYSLEKIREAIEEFRQQLAQLKDKQQYY